MLIVEDDFHQPGGECPNCGFLEDELAQKNCMMCGVALRPDADIIQVALQRVLEQGESIEILRSEKARHALEQYGRIGAILNTQASPPPEKDRANRTTISSEGEINRDALHDEAIEESFPASDPPSWS